MQNASRERTRCGQHRELLVFMRAALPEVAPGVELRGNEMVIEDVRSESSDSRLARFGHAFRGRLDALYSRTAASDQGCFGL